MAYERHLEENLFDLHADLLTGTYEHGSYQAFKVYDPKERQIHKASVRDRVVHQALVNILEPVFEPRFIFDSYSCRVGKGTHAAVSRLRQMLRKASQNHTRTVHVLQCDIAKFFTSVDHSTLLDLICRRVRDPQLLNLIQVVLDSFHTQPKKGLPLGNVTSQLFANIYLHELDHYIKHILREQWYTRYTDDFVIVHELRQYLYSLIPDLQNFLATRLGLSLHSHKVRIRTGAQGIDFLGYVILPHATVLRTKTANRMLRRVEQENATSYLGLCSHACAHELTVIIQNKLRV